MPENEVTPDTATSKRRFVFNGMTLADLEAAALACLF